MSTGNTSLGVFRALRLDDEVRGRLIQSSMSTRYPIVIGALIAAILFAVSGIPRMEWGIGACAMIALEGVVAKRYPSVPRTIVVDSLALALAIEFLPLPLEFSGLAFLYFGIVVMLMTWGWKAWALAAYLAGLYVGVAFFDPFGEIVRSQAQIIAFGFVAGLIFVLLTMSLIGSVISLLQSQAERIEAARASLAIR